MNGLTGEIRLFAGNFVPEYFLACDGSSYSSTVYSALFDVIGYTYGGSSTENTFMVPNLTGIVPLGAGEIPGSGLTVNQGNTGGTQTIALTASQLPAHTHNPQATATGTLFVNGSNGTQPVPNSGASLAGFNTSGSNALGYNTSTPDTTLNANTINGMNLRNTTAGSSTPHNNMQPYVAMNYIICYQPDPSYNYTPQNSGNSTSSNNPVDPGQGTFGEIRLFAGIEEQLPDNWVICNGQTMSSQTDLTLFGVVGATFTPTGSAPNTFAIPDLTGRVVLGACPAYPIGNTGGEFQHSLSAQEMPAHTHTLSSSGQANLSTTAMQGNQSVPTAGATIGSPVTAMAGVLPLGTPINAFIGAAPNIPLHPATLNLQNPVTNAQTGNGFPHNNTQPYLGISFIMCIAGPSLVYS